MSGGAPLRAVDATLAEKRGAPLADSTPIEIRREQHRVTVFQTLPNRAQSCPLPGEARRTSGGIPRRDHPGRGDLAGIRAHRGCGRPHRYRADPRPT